MSLSSSPHASTTDTPAPRTFSSKPHHSAVNLGVIALTLAFAYGIWYAYSVFLVALLKEFGWKRSVLAGAFSSFAIVQGVVNPFLGTLCDRVRPPILMATGGVVLALALFADSFIQAPQQLYLYFGIFTAIGVALCGWAPALVLVQRRYATRLGLALGIISAGVGLGMLIVPPLCQFLIELHDWRTAFRWLALGTVVWVLPASLYLLTDAGAPGPRNISTRPPLSHDKAAMTLQSATRTGSFWLLVLAFFCGTYCSQTLHVHQVAFLVDHGIASMRAASVVGLVGLASIFGKIGGGWLSDHFQREIVYCSGVAILVLSVLALYLVGITATHWGVYVYAVMLGLGYSATASLTPAMFSDRFAGPRFGTIIGMGLLASSIGSASGPWMAGHLFDVTGSYTLALCIAAGAGTVAGLCAWQAGRRRMHLVVAA